ncbi:MAG: tyrosine-specific transport protein [Gammaproteobacteria bacterium]|nr:tyrosine-specific transport protein [Gammaproteobacteria bacterium]
MSERSKFFGSTLIISGTALGAGMLALPLVGAASGFILSTTILLAIWALMICTALLILEVNLAFKPYKNNFSTMSGALLGPVAKMVTWIISLGLLYSLAAAYIAGGASLISTAFTSILGFVVPEWLCALLFTIVLGGAVFWSTKAVDHLNRGLLSVKGVLLIVTITLLMPHVNVNNLARLHGSVKYVLACAPIFLCSLAFHHVIPSLSNYVGSKPRTLTWVIICGASLPVAIYILWLIGALGIVPIIGNKSFTSLAQQHGSVGEFVQLLIAITNSKFVGSFINGFTNIAMTTSFLGVTLGLFDFLADAFKRANHRVGRLQTALLTFIPPLIFAFLYPKGFVVALGYAAIFVAILQIIMPALMVLRLRSSANFSSPFRMVGGTPLLVIILLSGVLLVGLQLANAFHMLPVL